MREAVRNDNAARKASPMIEQEENRRKVLTWPDLVYTEAHLHGRADRHLDRMVHGLQAPLEQPANPSSSRIRRKAPWYFSDCRKCSFTSTLAGRVVFPGLIIGGTDGDSVYRIPSEGQRLLHAERAALEITTFLFGFLILWILLVILGTFLRGPN